MIVLHALWDWEDGARLHIWAESSRQPAKTKRGGRRALSARARAHPFALDTESLREALGELAGSLLAREAQTGLITLRLPAAASGPLASPELVREEIDATGATGFARWEVPALTLAALDITDELFRAREDKERQDGDVHTRLGALVEMLERLTPAPPPPSP